MRPQTYKNIRMRSPWLYNAPLESTLILLPAFLSTLAVWLLNPYFTEVTALGWLLLVVLVDVSHVYSTLLKTYLKPGQNARRKTLLWTLPLGIWIGGMLLYQLDILWFWRCIAYLAVYHFIRQQYGFYRIYARNENTPESIRFFDSLAIYSAAFLPVLMWHLRDDRDFYWMIKDDFLLFPQPLLFRMVQVLFFLTCFAYILKELIFSLRSRSFNIPKNAIWLGTALSWYTGIIVLNGDLAFTLTNVLAHGIPYMALVYISEKKQQASRPKKQGLYEIILRYRTGWIVFIAILFVAAWTEESLWNTFVWHEEDKKAVLDPAGLFSLQDMRGWWGVLVPLLIVPQVTHYLLDAYIWRIRKNEV